MSALYRRRIERPCREACAMPNIFEPEFDQQREHPGFRAQRARLGWQLATQRLGASIWEIGPGEAAYPYHYHLAEEELLIVLLGRPSVRTDGEWRELEPGEVLSFGPRRRRRPPTRELGRLHRALPRRLDQRDARSRRLPRLRQARSLRAPAPGRRPLEDLPPRRRRRVPRRRAAPGASCVRLRQVTSAADVPGTSTAAGGVGRASSRLPSSHAARRRHRDRARRCGGRARVFVRDGAAGGPGSRLLVLAGIVVRARSAQYIVVWAVAPLLFWATYPDPSGSLAAVALAGCAICGLLSARERPGAATDGVRRAARDAATAGRGRSDGQRAAGVRPAPEVTAKQSQVVWCGGDVHGHRRGARRVLAAWGQWFDSALGTPTPAQTLGWPADRGGRAHAAVRADRLGQDARAAFLWFLRPPHDGGRGEGLRVLYVSPLKALNYDVERNLRAPLAGIRASAAAAGVDLPAPAHARCARATPRRRSAGACCGLPRTS